jgi:hypothetical protein
MSFCGQRDLAMGTVGRCEMLWSAVQLFHRISQQPQQLQTPGLLMHGLMSLMVGQSPRFFEWLVRNWASEESFLRLVLRLDFNIHDRLETATAKLLQGVGPTLQDFSLSELPRIIGAPGGFGSRLG